MTSSCLSPVPAFVCLVGSLKRGKMGQSIVAVVCCYANPFRQTRQIILVIATYVFVIYDGFS